MPLQINNIELLRWVEEVRKLTNPANVVFCDGSQEEADQMFQMLIEQGSCIKLKNRPNSYYFRSDPADTARVESRTYICSNSPDDAGPLNNWKSPDEMRAKTVQFFANAFAGRTMYVALFAMGPIGSNLCKLCVQITDSPYAVLNCRILARMGQRVADALGRDGKFLHLLHATTNNPEVGKKAWPCDPSQFFVAHFTNAGDNENHVVSYGSGYGGNSLLGKKCVALRMASVAAKKEGFLAEHMLIMGVKDKKANTTTYLTCALPSACGKTNLAMTRSCLPNELEITTMGDDIAWLSPAEDGRLMAFNAENGFFGVAPGTNNKTNPIAMEIIKKDTIFTNVALYPDHSDIWFEGLEADGVLPEKLIDWQGQEWTPGCGRLSSHPNSRFTSPLINCPILDPAWDSPIGVPISGIIYGGRRSADVPAVYQCANIQSGVYAGLTCCSETTAAAEQPAGILRNDPFAMKPFLAYHIGDYIQHLLDVLHTLKVKPLIFHVNWFRRDPKTKKFLWPGFTENTRLVKWMVDRINGHAGATENCFGFVPRYQDINWTGLDYSEEQWNQLMHVDPVSMRQSTLINQEQLFLLIGKKLPQEMIYLRLLLAARL